MAVNYSSMYQTQPPQYSPMSGYGTQANGYSYVQNSRSGGSWSPTPASALPRTGSVLGATTGSTGSSIVPTNNLPPVDNNSQPAQEDPFVAYLNNAYSSAYSNLDRQAGELATQKTEQEGRVQSLYDTGLSSLQSERDYATGNIKNEQTRSLSNIGDQLQQLWSQGNTILGGRNASDSSASGMMNYAIGKLGSKMRGDLMFQYQNRLSALEQTYAKGISALEAQKQQQVWSVRDWYTNAVSQLQSSRSQLDTGKSTQLLNFALSQLEQVKSEAATRRNLLEQWAVNNSKDLTSLQTNLQKFGLGLPTSTPISLGVTPTTNNNSMAGYGNYGNYSDTDALKGLFGQ